VTAACADATPAVALAALIVAGSDEDAELVVHALHKGGYVPVRWQRVEDAVGMEIALAEESWDVVLSAHRMSSIDSFKALAVLGASGLEVPVIVVSGALSEQTAVAVTRAGAAEVSKDHLGWLGSTVDKCLRQKDEDRGALEEAEYRVRDTQEAPVALLDSYTTVIETGEPLELDDFTQPNRRGGESDQRFFDVRAIKTGEPLILTWRDVTERDRADSERARLVAIVRSSNDAIVSLDADLRIATWNNGAEAIYGYSSDEVLGKSSDILIPHDATLESRGLRERIVAGGEVQHYETQRLHKDGTVIDVAITAFVVTGPAGVASGATTITRDVTECKRAQRELAESDQRYREILDTTPDGVWRVDAENRTNYVNPRMASMLGYRPEEMIGRVLSDFMDPEQHKIAAVEMAKARKEGRPMVVENRFVRKDGTCCWARVSHRPLTDQDGEHSGALAIISDITASKAQTVELRETEHFLAALTDSMAEGMFASNRDGRVTYVNQAAEKLLGWTKDELASRSLHDTVHYQREDGSPYLEADCPLIGVLGTGRTVHVEDDTFTRRDGRLLPVSYSAGPITIDDQVEGVVVVFSDVSARHAEDQRHKRELETLNWVGRIRDAIDEERLVLYAQPIIDVHSREVVAHELLLRMVDRDGAIIAPGRFLPCAEQYGLITEIDRWVLAQAAKLAARGIKVHFNISAKSLGSRELISNLVDALRDTGAALGLLVCEITETALAADEAVAEAFVYELSGLGCEIALDDFGIGYGGLAYLKRLPINIVKIDIQFVRDLDRNSQNQHVVKAIVNLAQGFGRQTVAEGVENQATLELLEKYGVDYAQGYAIGRPAPMNNLIGGGFSSPT
jgi:PAS domain S-box-containing protein